MTLVLVCDDIVGDASDSGSSNCSSSHPPGLSRPKLWFILSHTLSPKLLPTKTVSLGFDEVAISPEIGERCCTRPVCVHTLINLQTWQTRLNPKRSSQKQQAYAQVTDAGPYACVQAAGSGSSVVAEHQPIPLSLPTPRQDSLFGARMCHASRRARGVSSSSRPCPQHP